MICRNLLLAAVFTAILGLPVAFAGLTEYQTAVNDESTLLSYYTFDLDTTAVEDTATGGHDGTLQGTAGFTADGGGMGGAGKALSLDGSGWVNFGWVEDFAFETGDQATGHTVSGSVEMWIKPGAATYPYDPCLAGVRDGAATRWSTHLVNNRTGWGPWLDGAGWHPGEFSFAEDRWYHVVMTWNSDWWTGFIYVDGFAIGSFWGIGNWDDSWGAPFQIGSSSPTGAEQFKGQIDEVAIYSSMLSGDQVLAHYEAMNGNRFDAPTTALPIQTGYETVVQAEPSLLSFYSFEGDTASVTDKAGSVSAPGTLQVPTAWTNGFAGGQALGLTGWGYVTMGPVPAFSFADDLTGTLEAWINPMANVIGLNHGRIGILSCADDYDNTYAAMELQTSGGSVGVESIPEGYVPAGIPGGLPYADKWYHVAAVLNAGMMDVYVNGKPALSQATLTLDPYTGFLANFQIGAIDPYGDWGFLGKIDEVAIYGDALTASQIAAHYAGAAMTFDVHEHQFINPTDMTPINVTLSTPTGQTTPAGLELTFSFDSSIVTVSIPALGVTLVPGAAYAIPTGLSSASLLVTPVDGGYGTTTLSVSANAASGWLYSDSADLSVILADQGLIIVNDHFDDDILGTNTGQPGGGFWRYFNGTTHNEADSVWSITNGEYNYSSGGIYSKPAGNFKFMNPQGVRIEWVLNNVELTANGTSGFPGGADADCRHELGVISANRNNADDMQNHELFRNVTGGFYVSVFYEATSYPTQNITVKGNIRVVNVNHDNGRDDENAEGLETPVTFELPNVDAIIPDKPLVVTIELDQTGWKVGFSLSADPVYTIADGLPGVSIDSTHGKVVGGWGTDSLGSGVTGAAITTEFSNGGFLWAMFQNIGWPVSPNPTGGRGSGMVDRVKACIGCTLVTDCPDPFADADEDGDVDQADFAHFQVCYTGTEGGIPTGCRCLDHDASGGIDSTDLDAFEDCASGPGIPASDTCDD